MSYTRICVIVADSVGIGALPDAAAFGDAGAHTLASVCRALPAGGAMPLPGLQRLGLGNIAPLPGVAPVGQPAASYGKMAELSAGKDTMTGHWELMGLVTDTPMLTFPDGFPAELISRLEQAAGRRIIGNKPASGTAIIDELGERHMRTGELIVYTSADSVLQIAAHEETVPLDELHRCCRAARELVSAAPYAIGRVIARPFVGEPGRFTRTANRRDYALPPPGPTVLNALRDNGLATIGVGKISDIFNGSGIGESHTTVSNEDGMLQAAALLEKPFAGLLFVNLVDFDSLYGHRRDPQGYARALMQFDRMLPDVMARLTDADLLIITADHGNDPEFVGNDHTREYVPLLAWSPGMRAPSSLGTRGCFADVAATIADNFNVAFDCPGRSFLSVL